MLYVICYYSYYIIILYYMILYGIATVLYFQKIEVDINYDAIITKVLIIALHIF